MFYVYAYLREKESETAKAGTPYYIGKGTGNRAWERHARNLTPKDKSRIIILESALTEIGAWALERRYIQWWGRKDLGTGILNNRTDGGEGSVGLVFPEDAKKILSEKNRGKEVSSETREKLSIAGKGRKQSEDHKRKIVESRIANGNHLHSEETKKKLSEIRKSYGVTEKQLEHLRKMSELNKGRAPWNSGIKTGQRSEEQNLNNRSAQLKRWQEFKEERDKEYYLNPSLCCSCGKVFSFRDRKKKFCNRQCSGKSKKKNDNS